MKNFLTILLCLLLSSSVVACAEDDVAGEESTGNEQVSQKYNKILVVFFSRTRYNYPNQWLDVGHTARVTGFIKELTGADSFEIAPVIPYPNDYEETKTISTNERDRDLRPDFKGETDEVHDWLQRIGVLEESSDLGAVEDIGFDTNTSARYYSLTGLPINKPVSGVFVRIKNGKAQKVSL